MKIYNIIKQLREDNSRLGKIAILKKNINNNILRDVFKATYHPYIQYYIRKIPEYKPEGVFSLKLALCGLDVLSERKKTGNAGIAYLKSMLETLSKSDAEILECIIQRDLKCGVTTKTINKVWSDLVPEYPVMLCEPMNEKNIKKMSWPAIVQTKMDGLRANVIVSKKGVEVRSRNGKLIEIDDDFKNQFEDCDEGVFDGELLCKDKYKKILSRKVGNGIINKAVKGTITEAESKMITMTVWDYIPLDDFYRGYCEMPYSERMKYIDNNLKAGRDRNADFKMRCYFLKNHKVQNLNCANKLFQKELDAGNEGIILKDPNGIWENKRAKHQLKFKAENEADLKIVDTVEGTGKITGMLGALVCESRNGNLKVNVGSGFSEEQRKEYWNENLVGKIVSVKYNEIINRKTDSVKSLFLPVFMEIREDKTVADKL